MVKMGGADGKLELEDGEEGWEVIWSGGGIASMNSKQCGDMHKIKSVKIPAGSRPREAPPQAEQL